MDNILRGAVLPAIPYVIGIDIPRGTPTEAFIWKMENKAEEKVLDQISGSAGPGAARLRRLEAKFPNRRYDSSGEFTEK